MIQKSGNTDLVPNRSVCVISFHLGCCSHAGLNIHEHGASCWPVSPGRVKPISASSVTELSPNLPRYVPTTFHFHQ